MSLEWIIKSSLLILFPLSIIVFLISLISILYLKFIKKKKASKKIFITMVTSSILVLIKIVLTIYIINWNKKQEKKQYEMCQKGNISYCNKYNTKVVLDNLKNAEDIMYITNFIKEYNMYREIYTPDESKIQQLGIEHYLEYILGDILYTDDKKIGITYKQDGTGTMYAKIIDKKILNTKQDVKDFKESIDKLSFKVNKEKEDARKEKERQQQEQAIVENERKAEEEHQRDERLKKLQDAYITFNEFQQLQLGMTYEECIKLIGGEGKLTSESYNYKIYEFESLSGKGIALLSFYNNKLESKTQNGLK
ncbi:hypothetical protein COF42_03410 [Bacillus wiedmannii]|uniref:hypothetical protein n=1 Tax=Bacillus wiedmannii TaxID=1890302 RepID=UPI000BFD9D20|nr:hypothetical protein [Bacillus wiedmannii]PHC91652.1 hypothetical protein COF42_03410 [Bacillus wiedmannii]